MSGATGMKAKSAEMSNFYRTSLKEGLVSMSASGVLTRDVIKTLRSDAGKNILEKIINKESFEK